MRSGHVVLLFGGLLGPLVGTAEPQVTPFRQDVTDAIDAGLTWFRNSTIYSDVGLAPQAKGLALRALLEQRASADFDAPILGYAAAVSADQELAQSTVQAILNNATYGVARGGCRGDGHIQMFAYFLEQMRSTPDGDGSLLDHSILVYGSGISDGNIHFHLDLPMLLVGGGAGALPGGRHVRYANDTPIANLYVTMLDKLGRPAEQFGDSTGQLDYLSGF